MDYKDTLNLPRTAFSMKADLVLREPERLEKWQRMSLYSRIQESRANAPRFLLHDGPPFANGDVHVGTALNKILKDIVVKYQSLRGRRAPYVPGWDCHGLPIEFKVSQEMRKAGNTAADPATIRTACKAYARRFIDIQRVQFKRLGVLGDWDNPYLTLDRAYEAAELGLFADLVEKGFVYRGKKPVYWSIPCRTALAEAEVEYADHISQSVYVKFPVVGQPGLFVVIWTTTPWTLPANLAVAYNSTLSYSMVRVQDETYIVSTALLPVVAEKCGWGAYEIVRSLVGEQLGQIEYQHPSCNRTGKLHAGDSFVENSTGTGFVHVAPGHGLDDYLLGSQVGLPIYSPVDDDGCLAHTDDLPADQQMPVSMLGKAILPRQGVSEANEAVLETLRSANALLRLEKYSHSYPHCWRSKTPVIFRAMDQWFVRIDHRSEAGVPGGGGGGGGVTFREKAMETIAQVQWVPDWGRSRIEAAVKSRPDWCISRQRSWGVPIPAFYTASGQPILDAAVVRKAAALFAREGSNAWFQRDTASLWAELRPENWTGPEPTRKSQDTLDVWIDSGSSSRSVLMQRPELRGPGGEWQADMYLEGSDQHRGWFQSSLLLSLAGNGLPPFKLVLTHGFMVDADREKISKSKQGQGGYEKPQTADAYVKKWGADVLRLWVASQDYRNDIVVSEERINKVSETYRGIRNALRYQLSNLYDFDPRANAVPDAELTMLDVWILDAFAQLEADVAKAYDAHELHVVYQRVAQFVAVELSAVYHDVVKDRLYTDPANSKRRRSTQTALHRLVSGLCRMLSPLLAFTADEAWEFLPGQDVASVHLATWAPGEAVWTTEQREAWGRLLRVRDAVLPKLEEARQAKLIGKALEAAVTLRGGGPELTTLMRERAPELRELLNVSSLEVTDAASADVADADGAGAAGPEILVSKAPGVKCDRCWHWETDVGRHAGHPTLCGRCVQAVGAVAATA